MKSIRASQHSPTDINDFTFSGDFRDYDIITACTQGKYEQYIPMFLESCKRWEVDLNTIFIANMGEIRRRRVALLNKAQIIYQFSQLTNNSILWLDIDCEITGSLTYFNDWKNSRLHSDIGIRRRVNAEGEVFYLTGTVFFNRKTCRSKGIVDKLLKLWSGQCLAEVDGKDIDWEADDQSIFEAAINVMENEGLNPHFLPPELCFIFDTDKRRYPWMKPVITHKQAHRNI